MTTVDEKEILEILEIEKLKQDLALDMKRFDIQLKSIWLDGTRLALYSLAVGGALMYAYFKMAQGI